MCSRAGSPAAAAAAAHRVAVDGLRVQVAPLAVLRVVWRLAPILHALVPQGLDSQAPVMHAVLHAGRGLQALRSLAAHVGTGKAGPTPGALKGEAEVGWGARGLFAVGSTLRHALQFAGQVVPRTMLLLVKWRCAQGAGMRQLKHSIQSRGVKMFPKTRLQHPR